MRFSRLILMLLASSLGAAGLARPSTLEGRWRLDLARSELLPGEDKPAELVMAVTKDTPTAFAWTVTMRMPDGTAGQTSFTGAIDGKPYPVAGRPGSTSAFSWTPDGALKQVSEAPGGVAVETCGFTPDRRTMTCDAKQTDSRGRVFVYEEVYDRE